jgi:hypothetical protein
MTAHLQFQKAEVTTLMFETGRPPQNGKIHARGIVSIIVWSEDGDMDICSIPSRSRRRACVTQQ